MKVSRSIVSVIAIVGLTVGSCSSNTPPVALVLYDMPPGISNEKLDDLDLGTLPSKRLEAPELLAAIKTAEKGSRLAPVIWKGYTWGELHYRDGSRHRIRISHYGGFYRHMETGRLWVLNDSVSRNIWMTAIH